MTDLSPLTALGGTAPRHVTHGALSLSENSDLALASLALRRDSPAPVRALPGPGCHDGTAFWTGPDQWLIEGPGRAAGDFAAEIAATFPGCSVTEQTDGFTCIEIASAAGPAPLEAMLSKLVNIDLGPFGPGRATRTVLEHMSVFVLRRTPERAAILGMRSAAGSLWHALTTAAARQG